jgi:hypothetical protein
MYFREIVEINNLLQKLEQEGLSNGQWQLISMIKVEINLFNKNIEKNLRIRRAEIIKNAQKEAEKINKQTQIIRQKNQQLIGKNERLIELEAELRSRIRNLKNDQLKKIQLENALIRYQMDCIVSENAELKETIVAETCSPPRKSQLFDW